MTDCIPGVPPRNNSAIPNSPLAAIYESGYKKTNGIDIQTNLGLTYSIPWVQGLKLRAYGAYDAWTTRNKNLDIFFYMNAVRLPDWYQYTSVCKNAGCKRVVTYNSLGEGQTNAQQLVSPDQPFLRQEIWAALSGCISAFRSARL
jgi:hypothetical protein